MVFFGARPYGAEAEQADGVTCAIVIVTVAEFHLQMV
jgi:hypothetical protein